MAGVGTTEAASASAKAAEARIFARPTHVAVIGGGIAGLVSAHFLVQAGAHVTVFEAGDHFGGLGSSFRYGDHDLDRFYHVILPTDSHLLALLDTLGIGARAYWRESSLGFIYRRRLFALGSPLDLLRFAAVPFHDRIRLGLTSLYAAHVARPDRLDGITVVEWLTRLSGRRAFDRLWRPLLEAKFGDAYHRIPALWYWASFNREKGTGREVKGSLRGGYSGLTDTLTASLAERGVELRAGTPVERLDLAADGRVRVEAGGSGHAFDQAVCTVPLALLEQITHGGEVGRALEGLAPRIDYQGALNVVVLLKRSLTPHYWLPVVDSGVPFRGIVETTRVIDLVETGGHHLVYLLNYVHRSDPLYARDAQALREEYVGALRDLFPGLAPGDVTDAFVFRTPFVEPLYSPGYAARKPPMELVPGRVYLATTTQVYPQVTSWNSSIGLARQVTRQMAPV